MRFLFSFPMRVLQYKIYKKSITKLKNSYIQTPSFMIKYIIRSGVLFMVAEIIVNRLAKDLNRIFDYLVPEHMESSIKIGARVFVPFGNMKRLENAMKEIKTENKNKYIELVTKLDSISPLKTLIRGYSLTEKDGKIIKKSSQIKKGDIVTIKFSDGDKSAEIL